MSRAYQEAHVVDSLSSSVKTLQSQTAELKKTSGLHDEKLKKLTTEKTDLEKKNAELETRLKANEHNASARLANSSLPPNSHIALTPLHDLFTNKPISKFPKHELDIRTMSPTEVVQALRALDVKTLGMSAGEKKGELRVQCGLTTQGQKRPWEPGV
ncbi:hypothetical protein MMC28_001435 [Mycoblastus sanguinarius]|nr:hypothetical protein [Mycoblastus sanguinarius]